MLDPQSVAPRKVLHIGVISICAASVFLVGNVNLLLYATLASLPLLAVAILLGAFRDRLSGRRSWGMLYFALVFALLLYIFGEDQPGLVFFPMAVLALADGFATLLGGRYGHYTYQLGGDERSYLGSLVFFIFALFILFLGHMAVGLPPLLHSHGWAMLACIAVFLTTAEASSNAGRDNLWVPLACAYWLLVGSSEGAWPLMALGAVAVLAWIAKRKQWLDAGGAVAACLMGWVLILSPDLWMLLPAFTFFALGTAFSLLPQKAAEASHPPARSKAQVLANGGAPVLCLMLYFSLGNEAWLWAYVAGMAAALSDTASSEIGTRLSTQSYAILGGRKLKAGVSGGISAGGTLAGLAMAAVIPGLMCLLGYIDCAALLWISSIAFSANVADSLAGQLIQQKYVVNDGSWLDTPQEHIEVQAKGLRHFGNDAVNAAATTLACLLAVLLHVLL